MILSAAKTAIEATRRSTEFSSGSSPLSERRPKVLHPIVLVEYSFSRKGKMVKIPFFASLTQYLSFLPTRQII
jgi:hypothetical protein